MSAMHTLTTDAIREAMEVVRKYSILTSPRLYRDSCETLARWLVENAEDLAMGDEHIRARLAAAMEPLFGEGGK